MHGRRVRSVTAVLLVLLLAGCWDRREIEERSTVLAVGIDTCPEEARECAWVSTRQIAVPGRIPLGAGGGQGDPVELITVPAKDGPDSQAKGQQQLNRRLSVGHLRLLLFSEGFARQPMGPMLDYIRRIPEARRLLWIAVAEGRAEEILRAHPPLERVPALFLNDMIEDAVKGGRLPRVYLGEFLTRISNKGEEAVAPIIRLIAPDQPELAGLALFRGDRIVGKLSPDETLTYMELRGVRRGSELLRVDLPKGDLANVTIYGRKTNYLCRWSGGRIDVAVEMELESELHQLSPALSSSDPNTIRMIEERASAEVKRRAAALVGRLQKEYKADILAVGERVRAGLPSVWSRIDNWPDAFAAAHFHFQVRVNVRRTGMAMD